MMKRLLGLLIPASILAAGAAASGYAYKLGFIKPAIWVYLWPSLVAVAFLALGVACIFMRLKQWLWPLGTGFLVQTVGIIMMWGGTLDGPWDVLEITLIAVGVVLFIMLVVWLVVTLRARWLEKKMLEGVGGEGGLDQQELQKIRNAMQEALALLKRAGRGRNAIYELPWFPVIGRAKAGKTVAIKNSGLSLPVRKDWVKGIGGTHTLDFFFTPDVIFLDTPGEWTSKVIDEEGRRVWLESLRLLRKYRGRRPLDGLVVVVPADDLLSKTDEELQDQAGNIREVIDLMQGELKFRFPVYLLVSKCDLVDGFVDFFRGLPAQRRHEILGWSHEDPNSGDPVRLIPQGFRRVLRRLEDYRLEMLARIAKRTHARRLFFFTENFRRLERPLSVFADILFLEDPAHEPPVFRGFYFTSGTQGEGSPMGEALSQLARNLGVRVSQAQAGGEEEPKRSFFLLELFRTLMVGDEGLVSRTAMHWWRRRRDTLFVAFLPAGAAVLALFMTLLSYMLNSGIYREIRDESPRIVEKLKGYRLDDRSMGLNQALEYTEQLREHHKKVDGFNIFRRFGMRRPGHLPSETLEIFSREFTDTIFNPTLKKAEATATDPDESCADRMDVFYSIIWLRQGARGEWSDDLQGLSLIWGLPDQEAAEARGKVLDQFRYLKEHSSDGATFLSPINLAKMAISIKDDCSEGGSLSALDQYLKFQDTCRELPGPCDITECHDKLVRAMEFQEKTYERMREHIEKLREYLRELSRIEPGTDAALAAFGDVGVKESKAGECQKRFEQETLTAISKYADQKELIEACNAEWKSGGSKPRVAFSVVREQSKELVDVEKETRKYLQEFSRDCIGQVHGLVRLNPDVLIDVVTNFRRVACMEQDTACDVEKSAAARRPSRPPREGGAAPVSPAPADSSGEVVERVRPRPAGYSWLSAPRAPGYTNDAWGRRKSQWSEDLDIARTELSGAEKQGEMDRIRGEVEAYAQQYVMAWQDYLDQLDVRSNRGSVPLWIEGLAATPEFRSVLLPASQALQVGERETEPPFDAMGMKLQGLGRLGMFVEGGLQQYQGLLDRVANDLKRCETDHGYWAQYHSQVSSENPANSLVQATQWVDQNAGAGLAQGRLRRLLGKPLTEARDYVRGAGDLTGTQWKGLRDLYVDVSERFPFAGDAQAPLVEEKDLRALFGGKSGYARVFAEASRSLSISAEARKWVDDAAALSRIFFPEDQDEPQPLHLRIEVGETTYYPEKYAEQYRIDELLIYLGGGIDFKWKPGEPQTRKLDVPLFGKDASEESVVKLTVAERKGVMGRAFSKENFEEVAPQNLAPSKGPWAPLKLIKAGLPPGSDPGGSDRLSLVYAADVPYKKNDPGKIKVGVIVEGKGLARLLTLLTEGMPTPPASLGGNQ